MTTHTDLPPQRGHLTFVFTDLEGSTHINHRLEQTTGEVVYLEARDKMRERLLGLVHQQDGFEVHRAGDGHFFVFEYPEKALQAMLAFQRLEPLQLEVEGQLETLTVRIGAHQCESERSAKPFTLSGGGIAYEYSGDDTNFAARIGALGAGGQILLSESLIQGIWGQKAPERFHRIESEDVLFPSRNDLDALELRCWPSRKFESYDKPIHIFEALYRPNMEEREPGSRYFPDFYAKERNRYIERPDLQQEIYEALQGPARLALLCAEGGMGKTRLAITCATRMAGLCPDGVYLVSMAIPPEQVNTTIVNEAFLTGRVVEALPQRMRERWGLVGDQKNLLIISNLKQALQHKKLLLVLDNYESALASKTGGEFARQLIIALGETEAKLLLTSRQNPAIVGLEGYISLEKGLSLSEGRMLFLSRSAKLSRTETISLERHQEAIDSILTNTAGIPLAIELTASAVRYKTVAEIAAELAARPLGPLFGSKGAWDDDAAYKRHRSLTRTLFWSYELLSDKAKRAFVTTCLFGGPFLSKALEGIAQVSDSIVLDLLDTSMLRQSGNRYTQHHIMREFARLCLLGGEIFPDGAAETPQQHLHHPESQNVRERFIDWYVKLIQDHCIKSSHSNNRILHIDLPENRERLIEERTNVYSSLVEACALDSTTTRIDELKKYTPLLGRTGLWNEENRFYEAISKHCIATNNISYQAQILLEQAIVYTKRGKWAEALNAYNTSLDIHRELGDKRGEAALLHGMANVYNHQKNWEKALEMYNKSLKIQRELGDRHGEAYSLHGMANVYDNQNKWDDAIDAYNKSLEIKRQLGEKHGEASSLHGIGNVYNSQGDWDKAIDAYNKSLDIHSQLGDRHGEAISLVMLGDIEAARNQFSDGVAYIQQAIRILEKMDDPSNLGLAWFNLAETLEKSQRLSQAIEAAEQSVAAYQKTQDQAMLEMAQELLQRLRDIAGQ
ncbi:MAG: tetratricopeptide repeat protein [Armatimonas sp.]